MPAPTITERARAIKTAMAEVAKLHAVRQVKDALKQRNVPRSYDIYNMHKLISISDDTCSIEMQHGPVEFRSTAVKQFLQNQFSDTINLDLPPTVAEADVVQLKNPPKQPTGVNSSRTRRLPARYQQRDVNINIADDTLYLFEQNPIPTPNFKDSRLKEINGLLDGEVFEILDMKLVLKTARIFGSRFVDVIKNKGA